MLIKAICVKLILFVTVIFLLNACTFFGNKEISKKHLHDVNKGNFIVVHDDCYEFILDDIVFSKDKMTGYKVRYPPINKFNDFHVRLKRGSPLNCDSATVRFEDIDKIMLYGDGTPREISLEELNTTYKDYILVINDGYGSFKLENFILLDGKLTGSKKICNQVLYRDPIRIVVYLITHYKLNSEKITILFDDIDRISTYAHEPGKAILTYTGIFTICMTLLLIYL